MHSMVPPQEVGVTCRATSAARATKIRWPGCRLSSPTLAADKREMPPKRTMLVMNLVADCARIPSKRAQSFLLCFLSSFNSASGIVATWPSMHALTSPLNNLL